jgi:GxxExxY protein
MNTDGHGSDLAEGELTHAIIGASFEVLNELGHGLREKTYENSLTVEFGIRGLGYQQQRSFDVLYKSIRVDEFVSDLIVGDRVVVDKKVIERISDLERGQMLNYLKITQLRVGLIVNFKRPKLEWERIVR